MKGQVEDFKPYIPLIQGLRNPGMRMRHWEMLSNDLGFPVQPKVNEISAIGSSFYDNTTVLFNSSLINF